jgi:branched-subunit amino acid aminotransferase/4-amino-4-deoxychorismate lyase
VVVQERTLFPEDLYAADEVFVSSTNRSMLSVSEIAGKRIPIPPEPVARRLEKIFNDYVRQYVEARSVPAVKAV